MRSNRLILSVLMVGLAAGLLMIGSGVGTMSLAMAGTPVGELKGYYQMAVNLSKCVQTYPK